jgi:N-acetyl-anhydromuramyl-L-alanine amidase AmpD
MSSDYGPAIWIPSPFYWQGHAGFAVRWIIIHGTAGGSSAQGVAEWFQNSQSQASTHYVIGQDGTVVQCVAESNSAWGNGIVQNGPGCNPAYTAGIPAGDAGHGQWWNNGTNPNWETISIEHVKPHIDNSDQLTSAQQEASFALVADLCDRWNIPRHWADAEGGITGHFSIESIDRSSCPGPYPWEDLFAYLGGDVVSQQQYDEVRAQAVAAEQERDQLQTQLHQLEAQYVSVRSQAVAAEHERDQYQTQLSALETQYASVRSQAVAAEQERNTYSAQVTTLTQQNTQLQQQLTTLTQQNAQLQQQLAVLNQQVLSLQGEVSGLQQELA